MKVEIKQIIEEKEDAFLLIRCCKPQLKEIQCPVVDAKSLTGIMNYFKKIVNTGGGWMNI